MPNNQDLTLTLDRIEELLMDLDYDYIWESLTTTKNIIKKQNYVTDKQFMFIESIYVY